MSRSVCPPSIPIRSTEPMLPPASPMAVATRPSIPGRWSISTRRMIEYCAETDAICACSHLGGARGRDAADVLAVHTASAPAAVDLGVLRLGGVGLGAVAVAGVLGLGGRVVGDRVLKGFKADDADARAGP